MIASTVLILLLVASCVASLVSLVYALRARACAREAVRHARDSLAHAQGQQARQRNPIGQPDPNP